MSGTDLTIIQGAWKGFKRMVASAKVQTTVGALTTAWFSLHYEAASLPPMQRCVVLVAFQGAVVVCVREIIAAWSAEDVADKSLPPAPATQVRGGADSTNTQQTAAAASPAQPLDPSPAAKPAASRVVPRPQAPGALASAPYPADLIKGQKS